MIKTFKFRLYPNQSQQQKLQWTLSMCRNLYNAALEERITAYRMTRRSPSCYDQIKELPGLKKEIMSYKRVFSQVLQNVLKRLDLAYGAFFRRIRRGEKPGFPRFQGYYRYDSLTYPQGGFKVTEKRIFLSKIGHIKIRGYRPIHGKIKTCTVRREANRWFVCLSCEIEPELLPQNDPPISVGIDLGIKQYAVFSNGSVINKPSFTKKSEASIAFHNQQLALKQRGSQRRYGAKIALQKAHLKVKNQRKDFLHKLSHQIISSYDIIVMEKLNPSRMLSEIASINKATLDASWSTLLEMIAYKAEYAGRQLILVDPAYTSQTCSCCNSILKEPLQLKDRVFKCPDCLTELDRDLNAARNILRAGVQPASDRSEDASLREPAI